MQTMQTGKTAENDETSPDYPARGCGAFGRRLRRFEEWHQWSSSSPGSPPPPGLVVDVTISKGTVTPTNGRWQAKAGQPIEFRVNSDADNELHVHSTPDHEFTVAPKQGQTFQFTVNVPGQVEVELHRLGRTVGTVQVQQ
jgi:hypothetical protein